MVTAGPIISSTTSIFREINVFRIVEILVRGIHDGVNHPGFQIKQHCSRYVMLIISLKDKINLLKCQHKKKCTRLVSFFLLTKIKFTLDVNQLQFEIPKN